MITQPHITAAHLAHVTAPVFVLAGERTLIPDARLHIFLGALLEVPDASNEFFFAPP